LKKSVIETSGIMGFIYMNYCIVLCSTQTIYGI